MSGSGLRRRIDRLEQRARPAPDRQRLAEASERLIEASARLVAAVNATHTPEDIRAFMAEIEAAKRSCRS